MKHSRIYLLIISIFTGLVIFSGGYGQTAMPRELRKAAANPEEIVSMSPTLPFNQAMAIIGDLSKKYSNKLLVNQFSYVDPIEVKVDKMHWIDAMEAILYKRNLWYNEYADFILVHQLKSEEEGEEVKIDSAEILFSKREVKINAVFFEVNDTKLKQVGSSWNFFSGGGDTAVMTAGDGKTGFLELTIGGNLDYKGFEDIVNVFKVMESKQVGDIIASPQVTVMSGQEGNVQIGSDFSTTTLDFAGNAITTFFSTGSIMKVTPTVLNYKNQTFIHMSLDVEKSYAQTAQTGVTEIKKTNAKTSVLLLDGEETVIGGLYSNEENVTREGVPILKDLPWWVLGLRYLFGYESKSFVKKELMIVLKANLLPSLTERIEIKAANIGEQKTYQQYLQEMEKAAEEGNKKE